jgi:hypothetical protein
MKTEVRPSTATNPGQLGGRASIAYARTASWSFTGGETWAGWRHPVHPLGCLPERPVSGAEPGPNLTARNWPIILSAESCFRAASGPTTIIYDLLGKWIPNLSAIDTHTNGCIITERYILVTVWINGIRNLDDPTAQC